MQYSEERYIGKKIQLYPSDTDSKWGTILDVDDLGWTIKITKSFDNRGWKEGTTIFINHATNFRFAFV